MARIKRTAEQIIDAFLARQARREEAVALTEYSLPDDETIVVALKAEREIEMALGRGF